MNDAQNQQNLSKKSLIWGGSIAAIVIAFVVLLVMLMSSNETPTAFLAKWKNSLESGSVKKYETLWLKSARQRADAGYQDTVKLLTGGVRFEVNLGGATQTFRVPRYPNRYRIEGVPVTAHFPGESQEQLRNLVIEKKGLIQQRWKIMRDQIVGDEFITTLPESEPAQPTVQQPKSPVVPVVTNWKAALESPKFKDVY